MPAPQKTRVPLPDWLVSLAIPLWVTDEDQRLVFLNRAAQVLLDRPDGPALGRHCYEVLGGVDRDGAPVCQRQCPPMRRVARGARQKPVHLQVRDADGRAHRLLVLPIPLWSPDGVARIVHCAVPEDRVARIENYLQAVAARDQGPDDAARTLTAREGEILDRLARDESAEQVAARLHLSPHTVRNHIRHILQKLHVHSVQAAVACYLVAHRRPPVFPPAVATGPIRAPLTASRSATAAERAARAAALAHPTRQLLLDALADGEQCVSQLTARVRGGQSGISRHLTVLRRAGLVLCRREGSRRQYRLAPHPLLVLRNH